MFEKLGIGATFDYGKFKGQVNEIGGNSNGNNGRASKAGKGGKSNNVDNIVLCYYQLLPSAVGVVISISEGEISFFAEGVAFVLELVLMVLFSLLIALGSSKRLRRFQ
ncbi:MAG: hypothetical protein EZS28_041073 [Streblomastix strix]|uniref:Uncharacterized protein n=1 Tax=Streblomastix strix TaxID=222440 RepID=A0A5J4TZJ1_9EUKA|nr:MAG: hypothetical protein EZS28_041073 [Streblomastix strix]